MQIVIHQLFISPGHNFFGRFGQAAGENKIIRMDEIFCREGWGIEGDRFYGHRPDFKGQITFFAWETYEAAKRELSVPALAPEAFRRNVLIAGANLNALIGRRFTLGGVTFEGTEESKPCHWMNAVVAPDAEQWLRGRGGLRAKIVSDGRLAIGAAELTALAEEPELSRVSAGSTARA